MEPIQPKLLQKKQWVRGLGYVPLQLLGIKSQKHYKVVLQVPLRILQHLKNIVTLLTFLRL